MTIIRGLAVAAALTCLSLGFAAPASAQQEVLEGVYAVHRDGEPPATWTIFPTCVPTIGDLREPLHLPVACTLHVAGSPGIEGGAARMTGGLWTFSTPDRKGAKCTDGSWATTTEVYSFDGVTLTGTHKTLQDAVCGLPAAMTEKPFSLTYAEPLAHPVERYPLDCEPGGLRRCR